MAIQRFVSTLFPFCPAPQAQVLEAKLYFAQREYEQVGEGRSEAESGTETVSRGQGTGNGVLDPAAILISSGLLSCSQRTKPRVVLPCAAHETTARGNLRQNA